MTIQLFLEYSNDDFNTFTGPLQITTNVNDNVSPNLWETSDGLLNIIWFMSGTFDGIDNPVVYLRQKNGRFYEDDTLVVKDDSGNAIVDVSGVKVKQQYNSDNVVMCYWRDNALFIRKGEQAIEVVTVESVDTNRQTYVFSPETTIVSGVTEQTPEIIAYKDGSINIMYIGNSDVDKMVKTFDMVNFYDVSITDSDFDNVSSAFYTGEDTDIMLASADNSEVKVLKSGRVGDNFVTNSEPIVLPMGSSVGDQYPGVLYGGKHSGQMFVSALDNNDDLAVFVSKDKTNFTKAAKGS